MTSFPSYRSVNEYGVNRGTHDPFSNLPDDPTIQLIFLIELHPYDAKGLGKEYSILTQPSFSSIGEFQFNYGGIERVVRLSQQGYITKPGDSQPNRNYLARVSDAIQIDSSILSSTEFSATQSFGGIEILNPDGLMDYLYNYYWDDRDVIVKAGTKNFSYDQFTIIFKGKISSIEGDEKRILLNVADNRAIVDQAIQFNHYGGTGGADGMASITGYSKPMTFGQVFNIQPVIVNYGNQIYQLHDGPINSIQSVRDRGVRLTFNIDVPDIFAAASPPAGYYNTSLVTGMIRLGSTASGQITVDAIGETNAGGMTGIDLAYRILTTRLGVYNLQSTDFDASNMGITKIASPYVQGIFINGSMTGIDVLNALITGIDDYWSFTRQGALLFGSPSINNSSAKIKRIELQGVTVKQTIAAAYEIDLNYARSYTVQTTTDLASPTDTDRVFATTEYRSISAIDLNVRIKNKAATVRQFSTLIALKSDAQILLSKLANRYGTKRQTFEMTVYNPAYKYFIGDTVQLTHNRFNLDAGRNLLLVGISENTSTNQTKLTVWG